jgi:hypothetical protein
MMRLSTNRVNPAVQQRTVPAGATRQSAVAAPLGSRGAAFRAAESQRGAPAQRGPTKADKDVDEDEKDDDKESLFACDEDQDNDGADDGNTEDTDADDTDQDDETKKAIKTVKG